MQSFVRQMTEQFSKLETVYDIPNFALLDKLFMKLGTQINHKSLGKALGRANIKVQTMEQVELMEKEGLLDEFARIFLMLHEYSITTFGADDFFVEAASQFHLEIQG